MTHVLFTVPSFINGGFPASGVVTKDVTLNGTDDVTVIVKSSTDTFYTDTTRVFDTISSNDRILYQFIFPLNTQISSDTTTYTTPKKSVYVFSDGSSMIKMGNQLTKNVTKGDITIRPPVVFESSLPDSSLGTLTMEDIAKDSPLHTAFLLLYKLFMDMIPIFIFWALFVSISCWVKIKSDYLYPSDVTQYPFVFYEENGTVYHPFKSDGNDVCFEIPKSGLKKNIETQNIFFETLKGYDRHDLLKYIRDNHIDLPSVLKESNASTLLEYLKDINKEPPYALTEELKQILRAIYPDMQKMNPENLHPLSSYLMKSCGKKDKCTWDYLVYFLLTIALNNYLYCNKVLSFIHTAAYWIYDKVISKITSPLSVILFTGVLYFMFMGVGAMNEKVMKIFHIHLQKETSINTILLNQFYKVLVTILSCCFALILPLCGILVTTTLLATAYTLVTTLFGAFNMTLGFMALFTLAFSLTSYILIITKLAGGMNPLELIDSLFTKQLSVNTFFSFFGLVMPILMGIGYASYIGIMLFFTFFQFLGLKEVVEKLRSSAMSVVFLAFILLMLHVKQFLGNTYTMMTLMIIFSMGLYFTTITGKKGLNSPSNSNNERIPENKSIA